MNNRILLEIEVSTVSKLLATSELKVSEFSCVDKTGKQCLHDLFLQQAKQSLTRDS